MKAALKQELYRVFHSWSLLALLAVCLFLGFNYGSVQPLTPEDRYEQVMEARYGILHIDAAKAAANMADSPAETWRELYREQQPEFYWKFMCFTLSLIPVALVLTFFQLSTGRERGTIRSCALLGGSVRRVILARLTVFYLLALLVLLPIQLLQTVSYARGVYSPGVMLRCGVLRMLLMLALLSVYAWLGLCVRRRGLRIILLLLAGVLFLGINFLGIMVQSLDRPLFIPFPPFLQGQIYFFQPGTGAVWVILAILVSLAWIFLMGLACVRRWEKELGQSAGKPRT